MQNVITQNSVKNLTVHLIFRSQVFLLGASQDGIRKFHCCDPSVVEIKCPFKGKDLDPKIAFLLPTVTGKKNENGNFFS